MPEKTTDPAEIARHNDVTRKIIMGTIAECVPHANAEEIYRAASDIMATIDRRGYEPQIIYCNRLVNGKAV